MQSTSFLDPLNRQNLLNFFKINVSGARATPMDYPCVFAQGTPGRTLKCFEKCVWGCVAQRPRPAGPIFFSTSNLGLCAILKAFFPSFGRSAAPFWKGKWSCSGLYMGKEYICDTCKNIKCFTEMASYFGGHPRILKSCDACREKKKEELYIKHVLKRHKKK